MLNQVILIGKFEKMEKNEMTIKINYKNGYGEKEEGSIEINIAPMIAENISKYIRKNDLIGIKGSLYFENKKTLIRAEKVTFLGGVK